MIQSGLEPTVYRTRGENANHYITHAVLYFCQSVPTDHSLWLVVVCTTVCDSVCQWFVGGRSSSFSHQQDKPPWTWWYNWNIVQCCFALTIHNPNTELLMLKGLSWSWSHGSWIYNYLCNKCLSPRTLWVETRSGEVYSIQHYVSQLLAQVCGFFRVLRFPPLISMSVTIKVFWNIALNTITLTCHVNLNIFYGLVTKTNGDDNA